MKGAQAIHGLLGVIQRRRSILPGISSSPCMMKQMHVL